MRCLLAPLVALAGCRLAPEPPEQAGGGDAAPVIDAPESIDAPDAADPDLLVHLELDAAANGATDSAGTLAAGSCADPRCPGSEPGVFGNAAAFDGDDDFIQFATVDALDFGAAAQPFTVTLWYQAAGFTSPIQQVLMAQSVGGGQVAYQLSFEQIGGDDVAMDLVWKVCAVNCTSETDAVALDLAAVGEWVFVAGVWTGSQIELYVDGTFRAEVERNGVIFDGSPFMVGADFESGGVIEDTFNGAIDDLRIYKRALTEAEIGALRAEGL